MTGVTKEAHELMMAPVAQCAERLRACAISIDEAAKAFAAFAEAARAAGDDWLEQYRTQYERWTSWAGGLIWGSGL